MLVHHPRPLTRYDEGADPSVPTVRIHSPTGRWGGISPSEGRFFLYVVAAEGHSRWKNPPYIIARLAGIYWNPAGLNRLRNGLHIGSLVPPWRVLVRGWRPPTPLPKSGIISRRSLGGPPSAA